ncbi:MAG: hypothetical protein JO332_14215, partial [Planctomycetaceae bacterium]|nr:hypothetical protein [Planctomycetaceae bacterium]
PNNEKLAAYNDFLRDLAKEKKCLLADLNAAMQKDLDEREKKGQKRGKLVTSDGVHMNPFGNVMMATGVLRGFGLDDSQIQKAQDVFLDIPNGVSASVPLTLRQYAALEAAAAKEGKTLQELLKDLLDKIAK